MRNRRSLIWILHEIIKESNIMKILNDYQNVQFEENTVDPGVADDLVKKAIFAVLFSSLAIVVYRCTV